MSFKIKNIWEHPESTIISIIIFIATFYFVDQAKATFTEVWPAWAFVIWFLFTGKPNIKPPAATILFALFLFSSCSPQKRLARLVDKHPELVQKVKDTIRIDTFIVHRGSIESFSIPVSFDTLSIKGVGYKLNFYKANDSIQIDVQSNIDTVYIKIEKPLEYSNIELTQLEPKKSNFKEIIKLFGFIIIGILILILIIKLIK